VVTPGALNLLEKPFVEVPPVPRPGQRIDRRQVSEISRLIA